MDGALRQYRKLEEELRGPWGRFRGTLRDEWRQGWREARGHAATAGAAGAATAGATGAGWSAPSVTSTGAPPPAAAVAHPPVTYGRQVAAGMAMPLLAAVSAGITVAWAVASASLIASGAILGWRPPTLPLWGGLVALAVAASVVGGPFHAARRSLRRWPHGAGGLLAAWDALLWLGFFAVFAWLAWTVSGDLREVLRDLPGAVEKVRASWHPPA